MVKWVAVVAVIGWLGLLVVSLHDFVFEPIYQEQAGILQAIRQLHAPQRQPARGADLP